MADLPFFDLSGRVAIVTGGATGIGRGIAEGLAEAGADIVIGSRRENECARACREIGAKTGVRALPLRCDVTDGAGIERFVEDAIRAAGHVDILVNNAGVIEEKPILDMEDAAWDRMLDTNLKGVFRLTRAVVRRMIERNAGGKIINVASIAGLIAWPEMAAYCASKGGCIQLTKVMALEWVRHNIQANAILPGYFDTPMNAGYFRDERNREAVTRHIPMRRIARTDEIKGLAILLASAASSYITGAAFAVDGGQACT
jgi:NAD(P)-dependent dehydrogenase (short-subunit alcohol dehydrogenase family)